MIFVKIFTLLIPLLLFLIPFLARAYLKNVLKTRKKKKNDSMFVCNKCGTHTHESIIVKRKGKKFCSTECSLV
jgi:hypothetical protein